MSNTGVEIIAPTTYTTSDNIGYVSNDLKTIPLPLNSIMNLPSIYQGLLANYFLTCHMVLPYGILSLRELLVSVYGVVRKPF